MDNSEESTGKLVQEWLKLRFGIRPFAATLGVNHATLYGWLKKDKVNNGNLMKIAAAALEMGATPQEVEREFEEMGLNPEEYNINTSYDNITDSTIISGNTNSKIRNSSLYGQLKDTKNKAERLRRELEELEDKYKTLHEKLDKVDADLYDKRKLLEAAKKENQELKISKAKLEGKLEAFKEMLKDQENLKN